MKLEPDLDPEPKTVSEHGPRAIRSRALFHKYFIAMKNSRILLCIFFMLPESPDFNTDSLFRSFVLSQMVIGYIIKAYYEIIF